MELTDEQRNHVISWIADGKRNWEIRKLAEGHNFAVSDGQIYNYKKRYADKIMSASKEDWRNLALHIGLGRRSSRVELRQELISRLMDEIHSSGKESGFELGMLPVIKYVEELLKGIQSEQRDGIVEKNNGENINILHPEKSLVEQLETADDDTIFSALQKVRQRKEQERNDSEAVG